MPSFDVVSKVDMQEVSNALQHTLKEISQRFDFKGSKSTVELVESELRVLADDDYKLDAVKTLLLTKLNKRGISPKSLEDGKVESASGGLLRQNIKIIQVYIMCTPVSSCVCCFINFVPGCSINNILIHNRHCIYIPAIRQSGF